MNQLRAAIEALPVQASQYTNGMVTCERRLIDRAEVLRLLDAAAPALPVAPDFGLRDIATPRDEWPEDADYALGHLAGTAFGHAPSDEIGHCVGLIRAALEAQAVVSSPPSPSEQCPHGWPSMMHCSSCHYAQAVAESPEAADADVWEMWICEALAVSLHPGVLYRFKIDPTCAGCRKYMKQHDNTFCPRQCRAQRNAATK